MARGWESKSIEQQMEEAQMDRSQAMTKAPPPVEIELQHKRDGLRLQRTRILQELDSARNPRYRELLNEMLRHLEIQLLSQ